jgi:hypothetical protein
MIEEDCDRETAVRHRACRLRPDGARRPLGALALAGGRMGAKLRYRHDRAKRAMRGATQPDASSIRV